MTNPNPHDSSDYLSGMAGSILALIFLKPPVAQLIIYLIGGGLTSYYITPALADSLGAPLSTTGFIVGLFGMAIIAKIFHLIELVDPKDVISRILKKVGL